MSMKFTSYICLFCFHLNVLAQVGPTIFIDTSFESAGVTQFCTFDMDLDGDEEIFASFTGNNGRFGYYDNLSENDFSELLIVDDFPFCRGLAKGDFNNDDIMDIAAIGHITNVVKVYLNVEGTFQEAQIVDDNLPTILNGVAVADFDSNGFDDIVVIGQHTIDFYRNMTSGNFQKEIILSTDTSPVVLECLELKIADMDSDGDMDLVTGETAGLVVYSNDGNGIFTPNYYSNISEIVNLVLPIDIDQDDDLDVVINNSAQSLKLFINQGDGTLSFDSTLMTIDLKSMSSIDYDNDGLNDIFCSYQSNISILLNDSEHSFSNEVSVHQDIGLLMGEVHIGNLDNQNDLDYVWSGSNNTVAANMDLNVLSVNDLNEFTFQFAPNPTTGWIYFNQRLINVKVFDLTGRLVLDFDDLNCLDLGNLPSAAYFMIATGIVNGQFVSFTIKILKQ